MSTRLTLGLIIFFSLISAISSAVCVFLVLNQTQIEQPSDGGTASPIQVEPKMKTIDQPQADPQDTPNNERSGSGPPRARIIIEPPAEQLAPKNNENDFQEDSESNQNEGQPSQLIEGPDQ